MRVPRGLDRPEQKAPLAALKPQLAVLDLDKVVCKIVHCGPQPRCLVLPVGLELWVYVQKMRNLQKKR